VTWRIVSEEILLKQSCTAL